MFPIKQNEVHQQETKQLYESSVLMIPVNMCGSGLSNSTGTLSTRTKANSPEVREAQTNPDSDIVPVNSPHPQIFANKTFAMLYKVGWN